MLTCVVFRSDSLAAAGSYFLSLFHIGSMPVWSSQAALYLREYWIILLAAVLCAAPTATWIRKKLTVTANGKLLPLWDCVSTLALLAVFVVAVCFTIKGTYNPFIYFNF